MIEHRLDEALPRFTLGLNAGAAHAQPSLDERANQPRPNRALVISAVALAHAATIMGRVTRLVGREGAQAERRPEPALDRVYDSARRFAVDQGQGQTADGEDLIGAKRRVAFCRLMIDI